MGGIIFVIFFVVAVGGIASAFLLFHRKAVRDSRRVGLPMPGGQQHSAAACGGRTRSTRAQAL
jgi:hypothetical protein